MAQLEHFRADLKLAANPDWVREYLLGKSVYPIHIEVDPTNKCPLDCSHCVWHDYRSTDGPANTSLSRITLLNIVEQASELSIRGITWTGGGEPLRNPYTVEAIQLATAHGIKNGMFTTAVPLGPKVADSIINDLSWMRFHLDGATPVSYAQAHHVPPEVFYRVTKNIRYMTQKKRELGVKVLMSIGAIALPSLLGELAGLAYLARDLGLDFFHYKHDTTQMHDINYLEWWNQVVLPIMDRLSQELESDLFKLQYSKGINYMAKDQTPICHIHNADTAITATGDVAFCKSTRDHADKYLGNVNIQTLREIFDGDTHQRLRASVTPQNCGILPCPLISVNQILGRVINVQSIESLGKLDKPIQFPEFL